MPRFNLKDLTPGDVVHDMHDHFEVTNIFGPCAEAIGTTVIPTKLGAEIIRDLVRESAPMWNGLYTNKELVYLGIVHWAGRVRHNFAYSYDGTRLGFISVVEMAH